MIRPSLSFLAISAALVISLAPAPAAAQTTDRPLTPRTFIDVSRKVLPSVVSINVRAPQSETLPESLDPSMEEFLRRYFQGRPIPEFPTPSASSGSGFIFRVDGSKAYVLTNNHVLQRAEADEQISIQLDPAAWEAPKDDADDAVGPVVENGAIKVEGRDELADLAIISFEVPDGVKAQPLAFADSKRTEVGEWVLVLGNPLEFNNSVSQGIISAKGRYLGRDITIQNLFQTTASINPGNSGGPMVNLDGDVIGISNAIASRNGLWQGVGFAIPSNDAAKVASQLLEFGQVQRGYLGVEMAALASEPQLAKRYGVEDMRGVLVARVQPNTPAAASGIEPADLIKAIDSRPVRDPDEMLRAIASRMAGDTIKLDVIRLGEEGEVVDIRIETALSKRPTERELAEAAASDLGRPGMLLPESSREEEYGLTVRESRAEGGLVIEEVEPGSLAEAAGLREGDVLRRVNGRRVRNEEELRTALGASAGEAPVVSYQREGATMFTTIPTP